MIRFSQSKNDFPLTVALGDKIPSWGLDRWKGNSGLRFIPPDDEGFNLRGDKRRLLYKGRRRSHRFTILGDNSFEYDCILEREPESNVVTLLMEGAEKYDFFRQPDFVPDPFLKGSYAVYKKETLIGEGTGKLCHIHRPEIIDARGRRCWGDLAIVGNVLRITIPEQWLGEAAYPVIVDPAIGTTTIGSQLDTRSFQKKLLLTKYFVPEKVTGACTAVVRIAYPDLYGAIAPSLYTDNNDLPHLRKSKSEQVLSLAPWANDPPYWASLSFEVNGALSRNGYCWFGVNVIAFMTNYDFMDGITHEISVSTNNVNPAEIRPNWDIYYMHNKRYSWYFSFISSPPGEDHFCILTGNLRLTDSKKQKVEYKRSSINSINGTAALRKSVSLFRKCLMNVRNSMSIMRTPTLIRRVLSQVKSSGALHNKRELSRKCGETSIVHDVSKRCQGFSRVILENLWNTDIKYFPVVFIRTVSETQRIGDTFQKCGEYVRGLYEEAGSLAETIHGGEYYRAASETVQAEGKALRSLHIFIKLLTTSFVRDFILWRFLIAKDEIVLKSRVSREVTLDSRID